MSEKKKKLIIFGFLSLGLLVSLLAFYIFKSSTDDIVNVKRDDTKEDSIRGQIIKKIGYRPYFAEDESTSPLHFSSAFLVDMTTSVCITVLITVALIKTEKFDKTLELMQKKARNKVFGNPSGIKKTESPVSNSGDIFSASKYQIILLSIVYLLSFFVIYPVLFLLLSLYRKISSFSAYNYLKQLVKKNKILVCLYSTLGLVLSFIIGYLCLYLKITVGVFGDEEEIPAEASKLNIKENNRLRGTGFRRRKMNQIDLNKKKRIDINNFMTNFNQNQKKKKKREGMSESIDSD